MYILCIAIHSLTSVPSGHVSVDLKFVPPRVTTSYLCPCSIFCTLIGARAVLEMLTWVTAQPFQVSGMGNISSLKDEYDQDMSRYAWGELVPRNVLSSTKNGMMMCKVWYPEMARVISRNGKCDIQKWQVWIGKTRQNKSGFVSRI